MACSQTVGANLSKAQSILKHRQYSISKQAEKSTCIYCYPILYDVSLIVAYYTGIPEPQEKEVSSFNLVDSSVSLATGSWILTCGMSAHAHYIQE